MTDLALSELLSKRPEQARALQPQAARDGLRFECYLPSDLASWVLKKVEQKAYNDPAAAIYAIVNDHVQLYRLERVREALQERSLARSAGFDFPEQTLEEVAQSLIDKEAGRGVPAYWHYNGSTEQQIDRVDDDFIHAVLPRFSTYSEAAHWYLSEPLAAFEGATAADLVRGGQSPKKVLDYLEAVSAGMFA